MMRATCSTVTVCAAVEQREKAWSPEPYHAFKVAPTILRTQTGRTHGTGTRPCRGSVGFSSAATRSGAFELWRDGPGELTMATADQERTTQTDLEYAIQLIMAGKKDPEFAARVQAETEKITEEIEKKHGVTNIAVDLIREARDDA